MVEFLDSVTLQKLVEDQLAKGVQIENKPAVKRAISSQPVVKPIRVNAPNSVFALGRRLRQVVACTAAPLQTQALSLRLIVSPVPHKPRHDTTPIDLHGLRRDDAGRPARRGRDDSLAARTFRQPVLALACVGLGSRRGRRARARAGRRADRRRPARDRLDFGRDRVEQPGDQGRGALLQDARQAPDHGEDRAQGRAGHDARARAPGLRGDLPRRRGRRPARPRSNARRRSAPTPSWSA